MFGVVPRVLWEKLIPPDEFHRIPMALRCLLLEKDDQKVLIDTGIGTKWSPKEMSMYGIDHSPGTLVEDLARLGVQPEEITTVLLTHLHFDHAGGNTYLQDDAVLPTFPNADYMVTDANLEHALKDQERDKASYLPENWDILIDREQFFTFEPGDEVLPGIIAEEWQGHTPGMVTYRVSDPKAPLVYCADLIPTSAHVRLKYIMGYDLCARTTLLEKRDFYTRAVDEGWELFFEHDPVHATAFVEPNARGDYRPRYPSEPEA